MSISISEACRLVHDLTDIDIHVLYSDTSIETFCKKYCFHAAQVQLTPEGLKGILHNIAPNHMITLIDCFHLRFVFALSDGVPIALGPYCTEVFTEQDVKYLFPSHARMPFPASDLLLYREQFPIVEKKQAVHNMNCLLHYISDESRDWVTTDVDYRTNATKTAGEEILKSAAEIVEERYRVEQEMLEAIRNGQPNVAIQCLHITKRSVGHIWQRLGYTPETARNGVAVTRTMVRLAAYDAGLPALLVDRISSENSRNVHNSSDINQIYSYAEDMIREFCSAIYQHKNKHYSKLILCMIYSVEHEYNQGITVSKLAEELGVTTDYLIRRCKQEMGITPNVFLRRTRMNKAAQLLRESTLSVQEVSTEVGILDANYFVKLFRRELGQTPSAYRAAYRA